MHHSTLDRRAATLLATLTLLAVSLPGAAQLPDAPDEAPPPDTGAIQVGADTVPDEAITRRLVDIFDAIDGLANIVVSTESGIVTLEGEVLTTRAREQAGLLATRVEGVVEVDNRITEVQDVSKQLERVGVSLWDRVGNMLRTLPLLFVAIGVFAVFAWFAGWLARRDSFYNRIAPNAFIAELIGQVVRIAITVVGLITALEILDASSLIGSVLGALGLAGLAIGFALKDTVENYVASILMSLRQPFAPDDHVIIDGREGKVVRLTTRATVLMNFNGNHIRIPNATVFKATIENFTRNPNRRLTFKVGIDPEAEIAGALDLAVETLSGTPGVLADPAPFALIDDLGDSTVVLLLGGWIDQREADFGKVRTEAIRRVTARFDERGIGLPAPAYNVNLQPGSGETPARKPAAVKSEPLDAPVDVSRDDAIDRQVSEDRAEADQPRDLLASEPHRMN